MITTKGKSIFIGFLSSLPILVEILMQQTKAVNSFVAFVGTGILALITLIILFNLKGGFAKINLEFIERTLSLLYFVIAFISIVGKIFGFSIISSQILSTMIASTLPVYFVVLINHFNIKNIVVGLLSFLGLYLLNFAGFAWLILLNTSVAILIYYIRTKVSHEISFRMEVIGSLLIFFCISLLLSATLDTVTPFDLSIINIIDIAIVIFFAIVAIAVTKVSLQIQLRPNLIWQISWIIINYFLVVQTINLWMIDLLSAVLVMMMLIGILVHNGVVNKTLPKLSIIVPTYNGAATIAATFDSIRMQSHKDIEVIVVDDGSTDNTSDVVHLYQEKYPEFSMRYFIQKNADQLNAIKNAMQYITGDTVYILHSDDLFNDQNVVFNGLSQLNHVQTDGVFIDLQQVDGMLAPIKPVWTKPFYTSKTNFAKLGLLFGRNPYVDFAFWHRDVFEEIVYQSYLTNNMVAWYDFLKNRPLNMRNGNFIGIKYRIHEGNYLNSADGAVNVLSGELRIMSHILSQFKIPFFEIQSTIYRAFNKFKLGDFIPVLFWTGQTNPAPVLENIISRRLENFEHPFIKAIVSFYRNQVNREISITIPQNLVIYHGSDIRLFNRALKNNELPEFYFDFMHEMEQGFSKIKVESTDFSKLKDLLEFFCITDFVNVEVKK